MALRFLSRISNDKCNRPHPGLCLLGPMEFRHHTKTPSALMPELSLHDVALLNGFNTEALDHDDGLD